MYTANNSAVTHLSTAAPAILPDRARTILSYLQDPAPPEDERPMAFVLEMRQPRPYRVWNKEVVDVTKEVFWIFLHQLNVVSLPGTTSTDAPKAVEKTPPPRSALDDTPAVTTTTTRNDTAVARPTSSRAEAAGDLPYTSRHFPPPRPPVPAAPYVGGVEWDATNYLAAHLDLLNGLIASLPTRGERNALRGLLRASGWERVMGASLRTCKEKFYGAVHACLRTWVGAAAEDGWGVGDVRFGIREDEGVRSVRASPKKKTTTEAPRLEMAVPKMELLGEGVLGKGGDGGRKGGEIAAAGDGWSFDI